MQKAILTVVASLTVLSAFGQSERGLPFITNYGPKDYQGDGQNWAVTQDHRGAMYFGNGTGVYEFDGVSWRNIPMSNSSTVRSFGVAPDGTVFVGGIRDLGYLAPDDLGRAHFVSILNDIPENERDFSDVWHTFAKDDGVYFWTDDRLIQWNDGEVKILHATTSFHVAWDLGDAMYVREWERGIERLDGDKFVPVPGGDRFTDERVYNMLPFGDGRILVTTRTQGQFLFDGKDFKPWKTDVDAYLKENLVYLGGSVLPDGDFALPTIAGGVVILDKEGRNSEIIDRSKGIRDNSVLFTYVDMRGDLWLGLNAGMARIEISSPFTVFDARSGITSTVGLLHRYKGELYAASQVGVYKFSHASQSWSLIPGLTNQTFSVNVFKNRLLVAAGNSGVFQLSGGRLVLVKGTIDNTYVAASIEPSKYDTNRVWIPLLGGISALRMDRDGVWTDEGLVPGPDRAVFGIHEDSPTTFWAGTFDGGLLYVTLPSDGLPRPLERASVQEFGAADGISDNGTSVFELGGTIYVASKNGYVRVEGPGKFVPDSTFADVGWYGNGWVQKDDKGRAWMTFGRDVALVTPRDDGSFEVETEPFRRLVDDQSGLAALDGDVVWFATLDGLVRYDQTVGAREVQPQPSLVRSVTVGRDSLVFGGFGVPPSTSISFDLNSVRFEFVSPTYQEASQNRYQTFLEGFDAEWSGWSNETKRSFTNLSPGRYSFRVRSRDVTGRTGGEARYDFEILPPWYRTIWAYGFYLIALAGLGIGFDRLMRRRVVKKERERSELLEAQLRAQAAEAQAQTVEAEAKALHVENERQKNIELLSEMGRDITATLSIAGIIDTVYENVNALMDATVFTIGIHNKEQNCLEFPATREKGESLEPYSNELSDDNRLAVACFRDQKEIVVNDWATEYALYVKERTTPVAGEDPSSILYLPLVSKDRTIGVISAQSFEKNAYTDYHLNILRNLATYAAIALDNAEAYDRLNATVEQLNSTLKDLKTTQEQLVTQEKMASLGQLTAGIAHEIKNPLNFVNNFAELNAELARDLSEELASKRDRRIDEVYEELSDMLASLKINAQQISKHGKRADSIVRNMMQHASGSATERYRVEVNAFVEEYIGLAYHGMRATVPDLEVTIDRQFDENAGNAEMAPQELGRVIVNLVNNALYAVYEKSKTAGSDYRPTVTVVTRKSASGHEIAVADNGPGIPLTIREKIFEPLFTTKPTGSGTGLGLSLAFDIVTQGHGGSIRVESEEGTGATFIITLPS